MQLTTSAITYSQTIEIAYICVDMSVLKIYAITQYLNNEIETHRRILLSYICLKNETCKISIKLLPNCIGLQ